VGTVQERYDELAKRAESSRREQLADKTDRDSGRIGDLRARGRFEAVFEEFRKHVVASGRDDILLRQTGCTGRCSREPIVGIFAPRQIPIKYERVDRELVHKIFTSHIQNNQPVLDRVLDGPIERVHTYEFLCCGSHRCGWEEGSSLESSLPDLIQQAGIDLDQVGIARASCFGACSAETEKTCSHMLIKPDKVLYRICSADDLQEIVQQHIQKGQVVERLRVSGKTIGRKFFEIYGDVAFFNRQTRVALRHNGVVDPASITEYFHYRGFQALARVLDQGDPRWVIEQVKQSKLRGRGGGGFPTGEKWAMAARAAEKTRYLICNADEGDPGAFMDRSMLESDPFNVVEGMIIGGYAIGATRGFFYVRAEYPLAIERIQNAIDSAGNTASWAGTSSDRISISTSKSGSAPERSCAARRRR
jgi:(2Fe-2S) ferredoxin